MNNTYLFIVEPESGKRHATFLLGVHGKTVEELHIKAKKEYPNAILLDGGNDYFNEFAKNKIYVNGKFEDEPPYVPTQEEINAGKIAELKAELSATDYKCLKYVDGALTDEEYAEVRDYRASLRQRINELEV